MTSAIFAEVALSLEVGEPLVVASAGGRDEEGPEDGSHSPVQDGSHRPVLSPRDVGMAPRAEVFKGGAHMPLFYCFVESTDKESFK